MEIFKIRNKEGLYWEGHSNNDFSTVGKQWKKIHHATSAINNAKISKWSYYGRDNNIPYDKRDYSKVLPLWLKDCEIVKFELIEKEIIKIEKNEE